MAATQQQPQLSSTSPGRPTLDREVVGGGGGGGGGGGAGGRGDAGAGAHHHHHASPAGPAPMATDDQPLPSLHAALASLAGRPAGSGSGDGGEAGGAPAHACPSAASPAVTGPFLSPAVDPAWAGLDEPDAVVLLALDGGEEEEEASHEASPLVSITARRARLGWEAAAASAGGARPPARQPPHGCPPGRIALYGGGGDPVEGDDLYACEAAGRVRVRAHEARLRAASPRFAVRDGVSFFCFGRSRRVRARARAAPPPPLLNAHPSLISLSLFLHSITTHRPTWTGPARPAWP